MMKKFFVLLLAASLVTVSFVACSDDPDEEHLYTITSEYAADFIRNREKFSEFTEIVQRSNMMDLLGTYGSYTVFAPTNEAVDEFLHGRGLTSVSQLSKED